MNNSATILIVEDEMIIAANISLQLTHLGYDVTGIIPPSRRGSASNSTTSSQYYFDGPKSQRRFRRDRYRTNRSR
jgi:hypothetical protein